MKKSATLYGGAPYWCLKINRFTIISSIHNSKSGKSKLNTEYRSFLRGCAGYPPPPPAPQVDPPDSVILLTCSHWDYTVTFLF